MIATMIESALRALLFAAVVGAGLRLLRVSNIPVRKAAWSLVLVASVAMPFLMRVPTVAGWSNRLGWVVPIRQNVTPPSPAPVASTPVAPIPVAPVRATPARRNAVKHGSPAPLIHSTAATASTAYADAPQPERTMIARQSGLAWPPPARLIALLYLAVTGALLLRLLWGLGLAIHLWVTADLVSPLVAPEPNVRSSARIPSPVTIGSGIVLPANYNGWDRKKLRMVLAHERSHVRQMDFYLQLLAGLYTALFWFSPLGWWLKRTLASLGEAIGDRAGLDSGVSRSGYAEILLEFAAMPRQTLPGVAMARTGNLSHRIERLLNEPLFRSAFAEGRRRAVVSLLLIPVALFAAIALIRVPRAAAQTAPPATPAAPAPAASPTPPQSPNPAPAAAPNPAAAPGTPAAPAAAPEPPDDQTAPAPPAPPSAPSEGQATGTLPDGNSVTVEGPRADVVVQDDGIDGYAWHFDESGDSYAIVDDSGTKLTFSGDWSEDRKEQIDAARKVANGPFLWFTHDGKAYIVTDPSVLARIRAMYKPMQDLGQQQSRLGKQQEALGDQMKQLSREQRDAGKMQLPDLSREIAQLDEAIARFKDEQDRWNTERLAAIEAKLKAEQDKMLTPEEVSKLQAALSQTQAEWSSERMAELQGRLAELQARLGELQGEAGAREGEFGSRMGALGSQEGALGSEQGRLGEEMGRLARQADRQMHIIMNDCLRNGKATQVPDVK